MQAKEIFRRAGLVLLNLTYGTTINIAKLTVIGGIIGPMLGAEKAWNWNILGKIASPFVAIACIPLGAIGGLVFGIYDIFKNFKNTIIDGNYKTSFSFNKLFEAETLKFRYNEEISIETFNELSKTSSRNLYSMGSVNGSSAPHIAHKYYREHTTSL